MHHAPSLSTSAFMAGTGVKPAADPRARAPAEEPAHGVECLRTPSSLYRRSITPRKKGIRKPPPLRARTCMVRGGRWLMVAGSWSVIG
jgi:hypothetical protein